MCLFLARTRNIEVSNLDRSDFSSDVVAEQLTGTSKHTRLISPKRSVQKQALHNNEVFIDSTVQTVDTKSNVLMSCELEQTPREPSSADKTSTEKSSQSTRSPIAGDASTCNNSQYMKGKNNLDLLDAKERKKLSGMSKTCPDNKNFNPEKRESCSILSFAEWLRGNNRNDASQMQKKSMANTLNIQKKLDDTSQSIGPQEPRSTNPIEEIMPVPDVWMHSHISRQESPKRGRKVKSVPIDKNTDAKESLKGECSGNISEISRENNCGLVDVSPQELGAKDVTENLPEESTKPITKKLSRTMQNADTSPKRGRKQKSVPIAQSENSQKATTSNDVAINKSESQILKNTIQEPASAQGRNNEYLNTTQQLNSPLAGESIDMEKTDQINNNNNTTLAVRANTFKSRKRKNKIRGGQVVVTGTNVNKDQQKHLETLQTKHDKKPNKRSEIDILIESMSKEMKDAGIRDLLNNSCNVKRQRAMVKKSNIVEAPHLNPASSPINEPTTKVKSIKDSSSVIESCRSPNGLEDVSKKSPTKRALSRKLINTKESYKTITTSMSPKPMEMEKALIDEVEIRNMNTSLLEPLKYEAAARHQRPSSKLAMKAPPCLQNSGFKHPKTLTTTYGIRPVEGVSQPYREKTSTAIYDPVRRIVLPLKCRKLKVRLNRRVVKQYLGTCIKRITQNKTNEKSVIRKFIFIFRDF